MRTTVLSMVIGLVISQAAIAANCCAPSCCEPNCCEQSCCQPACCDPGCCRPACGPKGCKLVCEMKKVKKECWVVECEDFCTTLPNCHGCKSCCGACGGCQAGCCNDGCSCGYDPCADMRKCLVPPKCGIVRSRKKLVKKTIECEVPVYKCVPVCCGCGCCDACGAGEVEVAGEVEAPEAPLPAAPLPPAL